MKALIYCKSANTDWATKNFGGQSPYMLHVVNKPLLEYYIDFCALKNVTEVRIVSADDDGSIARYFEDGGKWGLSISYGLAKENDTIKNVFLKNKGFCKNSELLVIEGYGFINYDKSQEDYPFFESNVSTLLRSGNFAVYYIYREDMEQKVEWQNIDDCSNAGFTIDEITNIRSYYDLSISIISNKSERFVLPGYSSEKGVFIGQNVEIAKSCRVERPVMIGNNVQLKNSASIGINTIIGNNVIIDSDATLSGSIVYGNSYVGRGVEIVNKIVYKNCLISPDTGDAIEIVDSFLTSKLGEGALTKSFRYIVHYLFTILMILIQLIPMTVIGILMIVTGAKACKDSYIISKGFRTIRISDYAASKNFFAGMFKKFSLDKFSLFVEAFKGNLSISGHTIYHDTEENREFIAELPMYRPGIFTYTESIGLDVDEYQCRINDSFYCQNRSLLLDIKIVFGSILNRFLN
ncbi:MAG: hypothetical protein ACIAQZ_05510 [Sedimentisphaeraceae bacterium JB056]